MKRTFLHTVFCLLTLSAALSCSSDKVEEYTPAPAPTVNIFDGLEEFTANSITLQKTRSNFEATEKWSDIKYNGDKKITGYTYSRNMTGRDTEGSYTENETRKCDIYYYINEEKKNAINTSIEIEYQKRGLEIEETYTEEISEDISLNDLGYITSIKSITKRYDNASASPLIKSSVWDFVYNDNFCTASTYTEGDLVIKYQYMWEAYQLKKITILKENKKDDIVEHTAYDYTFDTSELAEYSGIYTLPYVQSGFPQIYASMGYLGQFTPYILTEETQSKHTDYGSDSHHTENKISYRYSEDNNQKLKYEGIFENNGTYNLTFSK